MIECTWSVQNVTTATTRNSNFQYNYILENHIDWINIDDTKIKRCTSTRTETWSRLSQCKWNVLHPGKPNTSPINNKCSAVHRKRAHSAVRLQTSFGLFKSFRFVSVQNTSFEMIEILQSLLRSNWTLHKITN